MFRLRFTSSSYWEMRYANGGHSGAGSRGQLADYKATFLNTFFSENAVSSVIEWGCGDGYQAEKMEVAHYTGVDVSRTVLRSCKEKFRGVGGRTFLHTSQAKRAQAEVSLSLDVVYHLIEDNVYFQYLDQLFASGQRYVIVYSCDLEGGAYGIHVKPRRFTVDVASRYKGWQLVHHEPNPYPLSLGNEKGTWSDFYVYKKTASVS